MTALVLFLLFAVFYAYFGYPLILWALKTARGPRPTPASPSSFELPSATLIITVRNEAAAIERKLQNTFSLSYSGKNLVEAGVQVIVASDASDDGTDDVVRAAAGQGVELVRLETRGGKEEAQKYALESARGDILLFTDAKVMLESRALENAVKYFQDPTVGAISSVDRVEGEGSGEGMYVRYEMWLRSLESDVSSLVGLSGSCFAVRRGVAQQLRTNIPSDFALLLEARRQGLRGVHAPDVVGVYQPVASDEAEFHRKVRTVLRGMTALFECREVLNPVRFGSFAWQVFSHKLCRWLVPFNLLLIAIILEFTPNRNGVLSFLHLGMWAFLVLAAIGYFSPSYREKPYCKLPLFFLVVNAGIAVAWYRFFTGTRSVAWEPSAKGVR